MMAPSAIVADNIPFSAFVGNVPNASVTTCAVYVTTRTSTTSGIVSIVLPPWATKKSFSNVAGKAKRYPSEAFFQGPESYGVSIGPGRTRMAAMVGVAKSPRSRIGLVRVPGAPPISCGILERKISTGTNF